MLRQGARSKDDVDMKQGKWKWASRNGSHGAGCLQLTMTLRLVSNSYLDENTAKIRVKQVPWEVRSLFVPSLTL